MMSQKMAPLGNNTAHRLRSEPTPSNGIPETAFSLGGMRRTTPGGRSGRWAGFRERGHFLLERCF